jgi:hypothetical protein
VSTDVSEEHIASIFRVEEISSANNQQASSLPRPLTFNGLHGVISQKMMLFITIAVKTSNPINYRMSEKSGTDGNFNYFSYFYLQVKVKG